MPELSPEEERKILESAPKGTLAVILVYAAIFGAAWVWFYFVRFLGHGAVS